MIEPDSEEEIANRLKVLEKLISELSGEDVIIFTAEEATILKKIVRRKQFWSEAMNLMTESSAIIKALGVIFVFVVALKTGLIEWLKEALAK